MSFIASSGFKAKEAWVKASLKLPLTFWK